jgi:hypothetical protein
MVMEFNSILKTLKNDVSSNIFEVFIPSHQRKVSFRPITVGEQKTLSKVLINNSEQKTTYKTLLALIQEICLDEGFDVFSLTEVDRVKILLDFYTFNYFANSTTLTCENEDCGKTYDFDMNFSVLSEKMNSLKVEDKEFEYTTKDGITNIKFKVGYPNVKRVAEFHDSELGVIKSDDTFSNVLFGQEELFKLFVKNMHLKKEQQDKDDIDIEVEFLKYSVQEAFSIIETLPFEVFFSSDGLMSFLITEYVEPISKLQIDAKCPHCGNVVKGAFNLQSFFI